MKTNIKNSFFVPVLIAVLKLIPVGRVAAQTFTTLHSFTGGSDGGRPYAGLITNLSGNTLYGTAYNGGGSGKGTVFAVDTDGTGFTNLYSFTAGSGSFPNITNSDGAFPRAVLTLSGNTLYGTAAYGGSSGNGTAFAVNSDGSGFTNLHSFTGSDGENPIAGLVLSGNTLYGTAAYGGSSGNGTLFAVNTDGSGFTNLHSFTALDQTYYTNSDGASPVAGLVVSGNTLYGTASGGGSGAGTVFKVNTDGTGFTTLHNFTASGPNSDGALPQAGLILSGNTLYGTAVFGGNSGYGTVFAVNTDGSGFTNLHSFTATSGNPATNNDGTHPQAGLILSGNTLYGTAYNGSSSGAGTVFAVNTDGSGFTNLHSFTATSGNPATNSEGANPYAGLFLSRNTLYGTANSGGSSGRGTVFSLTFRPQLTIARSGPYLILSWPANVAGFDYTGYRLQRAYAITGPFANVPGSSSPYFIPITAPQQFFRLVQ